MQTKFLIETCKLSGPDSTTVLGFYISIYVFSGKPRIDCLFSLSSTSLLFVPSLVYLFFNFGAFISIRLLILVLALFF